MKRLFIIALVLISSVVACSAKEDNNSAMISENDTINYKEAYENFVKNYVKEQNESRKLRGFKMFFDAGLAFGIADAGDNYFAKQFNITATFGYQFNNYVFVGGGLAANAHNVPAKHDFTVKVPLYAMVHFNLSRYKKIVPFIDIKYGFGLNSERGMYFTPSLGVRFAHGTKHAYYIALQYLEDWTVVTDKDDYITQAGGIKFGYEF